MKTARKPEGKSATLWQEWRQEMSSPEFLTVDARKILGILGACRQLSTSDVEKAVGCSRAKFAVILRLIATSKHPIVLKIIDEGLPMDASVSLETSQVRATCKDCGQVLSRVPCCFCGSKKLCRKKRRRRTETTSLSPLSKSKPTKHLPGTIEKIRVMAQRVSIGQTVFCGKDAIGPTTKR